ncbi:putative membrane protein YagU involved in acid resistance [Neolewinella xylanilytica]|uniref:Putative membrane protein YagU involved in acid resistance n=1 Tax=Neolewinella xylanilytica TaxID=1514080 RepID=A0A2S6I708_9BACT|nr:DUF1440 domain-containing protein [Neolewinella xylanilytica]PPK87296.1 putative membrane protein YagU involved in acid resistance [Neolewinella xylanilytica]
MSFIDSLVDSVSDTLSNLDLRSEKRFANKKFHEAEAAAHNLGGKLSSSTRSAKEYAASAGHDAQAYAAGALGTATAALGSAGDYFTRTRTSNEPDYVRGFLAGMIGGLIGTGIKMIVDRSLPTAQPNEEHDARLQIVEGAEEISNTNINRNQEETAQQAINLAFGALVGGVYGVIVEAAPSVQAPAGIPFGAALWTAAHKIGLPALGLAPSPMKEPLSLQAGQLGSHMVYGATVEMIRRSVRHVMDEENIM